MIDFTGVYQSLIFSNDQNMFKIISVAIDGVLPKYYEDEIVVTGSFGKLELGETYHFQGELVQHPKFGMQFKCESYKQILPNEENSIVKYLSSDKFPGIGKKTAEKIVDGLGANALDILQENPDKLDTLALNPKQISTIKEGISKIDHYNQVAISLAKLGLNKRVINKVYSIYKSEAEKRIYDDPYELIATVPGYAFKTADMIGRSLKIALDDERRIRGSIIYYTLQNLDNFGNTYCPKQYLFDKLHGDLKNIDDDLIDQQIQKLVQDKKLYVDKDKIYWQKAFQIEQEIVDHLKRLQGRKLKAEFTEADVRKILPDIEKELKISYDQTQKDALVQALTNPISLLTGGPGTGKTTIVNGIITALKILKEYPEATINGKSGPIMLAAPTGRAAKRMGEVTGINAKTIHRLLGIGTASDLNTLNGQLLIVDECSMIDMYLFNQLLDCTDKTRHIVFVGDKDQLPSVGPGNVFGNLIESGQIPTTKLTEIHRQGDSSSIIPLAHTVNEGIVDQTIFDHTKDYSFIAANTDIIDLKIEKIVQAAIKKGFEPDDIQVLTPMYNGNGGVRNLNRVLSATLNPKKDNSKKIEANTEEFHIGDRILQLQNNPEKDIYNGQQGKITSIDMQSKTIFADFDGREVKLKANDFQDITLGYAMTIHKSQGSEYPLVILALTMQNHLMLQRNLLYTAITRAARSLVLVGDARAYQMAIKTPGNDRLTGLVDKLSPKQTVNTEKSEMILTPKMVEENAVDPMIGMDGITPQD
ncbi:MAG: ATP-dependent RecD-like DNA helicase [Lactobacillus sp.]|nr:ATP-dependent RecD-like DNA helicase [Lactobacillus sp.]